MLIAIFADTTRWSEWMPGIEKATPVHAPDGLSVIDLDLQMMGHRFKQRLECRVVGSTVRMRQVSGVLKKWQSTWAFGPAPGNAGTTASCELDVDLGMMALVIPARFIQDEIDRVFDETVAGARREVQLRTEARRIAASASGETLLEVFETRTGFEVWIGGRRVDVGKAP
jgi:ribosome-associated toxin RatA of RatAB toxin-antitoxin module